MNPPPLPTPARTKGGKYPRDEFDSIMEAFGASDGDFLCDLAPVAAFFGHDPPSHDSNVEELLDALRNQVALLELPAIVFDSAVETRNLKADAKNVKAELAQSKAELAQSKAKLAQSKAKLAQSEAETKNVKAKLAQSKAKLAQTEAKLAQSEAALAEEKVALAEKEIECAVASFTTTIGALKGNVQNAAMNEAIAFYQAQVANLDGHVFTQYFLQALVESIPFPSNGAAIKSLVTHSVLSLKQMLFGTSKPDDHKVTEEHTQLFWVTIFAVARRLMSESDRLEVVGSANAYFWGSRAQPGISLFLPGAPLRVLQCVKSVVELKTMGGRARGISQVVQQRTQISRHRPIDPFLCAVADDTALTLLLSESPRAADLGAFEGSDRANAIAQAITPALLHEVMIEQSGTALVVHACALMRAVRRTLASERVADDGRRSGVTGDDGSECVAVIHECVGKPTVSVNRKHTGGPVLVEKVFRKSAEDAYRDERRRIERILPCGLPVLEGVSFDDDKRMITFAKVGHRVRITSGAQFTAALGQMEAQIARLLSQSLYHGDISPRNMIMCCVGKGSVGAGRDNQPPTGGGAWGEISADSDVAAMVSAVVTAFKERAPEPSKVVSYHLIDFGETQTPDTNNFAFTVQTSYPLHGSKLAGPDALVRDLFALRVSLLILASEGRVLEEVFPDVRNENFKDGFDSAMQSFHKRRSDFFDLVIASNSAPKACQEAAAECKAIWSGRQSAGKEALKVTEALVNALKRKSETYTGIETT